MLSVLQPGQATLLTYLMDEDAEAVYSLPCIGGVPNAKYIIELVQFQGCNIPLISLVDDECFRFLYSLQQDNNMVK